jgi:hypothetical protein
MISDVDGFAMAMVLILTLSLGMVALLIGSISRSGKRRNREVEKLIDDVRRAQKPKKSPTPPAPPEAREPWEKDGDWWKK